MQARFRDRFDAGRRLAEHLAAYADRDDVLVLGLPRGGVPVAWEVARTLHAPLDVFVVRKLGYPGQEELAMGAIATGGAMVLNREVVNSLGISDDVIDDVAEAERTELERRERSYRGDRSPAELRGKVVILVDDGLATGATMRAAATAARKQKPAKIVVAVPVAPPATCGTLRKDVDELVCLLQPEPFQAVGLWYDRFGQTTDEEVGELLERPTRE